MRAGEWASGQKEEVGARRLLNLISPSKVMFCGCLYTAKSRYLPKQRVSAQKPRQLTWTAREESKDHHLKKTNEFEFLSTDPSLLVELIGVSGRH